MKRLGLYICLFVWLGQICFGQGIQLGFLPQVNVNYDIQNNWNINGKVESRLVLGKGNLEDGIREDFSYSLTDISAVLARQVSLRGKLGAGYLMRLSNGKVIHRSSQMYSLVRKYEGFKMGHRFLTDQTFESNEPVTYRLRYRISSEIPLRGQAADSREFYLKMNNEYLGIVENDVSNLEVRWVGTLGYKITDSNKMEWGIDARFRNITRESRNFQGWLLFAWYYSP